MRRDINAVAYSLVGCAALLLAACGSDAPRLESGVDEYAYYADYEYNYLSHITIDHFYKQLQSLQDAASEQNLNSVQSLETSLRQEALQYRTGLEAGIVDSDSVRRRAISAALLGFTGDAGYAIQLAKVATEPNEDKIVSQYATVGLQALGSRINESQERTQVMAYLARLMLPSSSDWSMRVNAVTAYGRAYSAAHGDTLTPLTDAVVNDMHPVVRRQALAVLKDIGDAAALPEVTRVALKDPDPIIRSAAAVTLGGVSDPRALEALEEAQIDVSPMVRAQAVYALVPQHSIEPELVSNLLEDGLADFDAAVRENAALAMGEIGDVGFTKALLQSLSDPVDNVRIAVINALAEVIPYNARKDAFPLVGLLDDGENSIVSATHRALKKITGENIERDSEAWRKWYYETFQELDPEWIYRDQPRPRFQQSGIRSSSRPRSPRSSSGRSSSGRSSSRR